MKNNKKYFITFTFMVYYCCRWLGMKERLKRILKKVINFVKIHKVAFIVLAVVIVASVSIFTIASSFANVANSQEKKLTNRLEELGKSFYEDYYYTYSGSTDEERAEKVSKYADTGIKVNLDNLARFNNSDSSTILSEFVNNKTNESCDKENTKVIIYPLDPYSKTSYKLEVVLECGFDEED